jgi:hypothetical protein
MQQMVIEMNVRKKRATGVGRVIHVSDAALRRAHADVLKRYAPAFAALSIFERRRGAWGGLTAREFLVVAVLHDVDPETLIAVGAPADEYAPEARKIVARIDGGATIDAELVRSTWERFFADFDRRGVRHRPMRMRPAFARAASKIRRALAGDAHE